MDQYTIYIIEDHRAKLYVGVTSKNIKERFRIHKTKARSGRKTHLHNSMRKYGFEKFTIFPLDTASNEEEAFELEREWIKKLGTYEGWGYNCTRGGDKGPTMKGKENPQYGKSLSEETRRKLSEAMQERSSPLHTEEERRKMSEAARGVKNSQAKLTRQEAAEIKYLSLESGRTQSEIADEYGISTSTVSGIKTEMIWERVDAVDPETVV
jgi:group I intron endonuclease